MTHRDLLAGAVGAALTAVVLLGLGPFLGHRPSQPRPRGGAPRGASAAPPVPGGDDDAWRQANANLAEAVKVTQDLLRRNEAEKLVLERELKVARRKLAASQGDGAPARNEYDLTQDDWKKLAASGTVKARYPCHFNPEWHLGADQVAALGLAPGDTAALETAYTNEMDRLAGVIQTGCAKVLGNAELARRLGTEVCATVNAESLTDNHADLQLVADIRAGNVPMPPEGTLDPFAAMLLAQTGAMRDLEADLAPSFGSEEAHRLAFADEVGGCSGTWGGQR